MGTTKKPRGPTTEVPRKAPARVRKPHTLSLGQEAWADIERRVAEVEGRGDKSTRVHEIERALRNTRFADWAWKEIERRIAEARGRGDESTVVQEIERALLATMPPELRAKVEPTSAEAQRR